MPPDDPLGPVPGPRIGAIGLPIIPGWLGDDLNELKKLKKIILWQSNFVGVILAGLKNFSQFRPPEYRGGMF